MMDAPHANSVHIVDGNNNNNISYSSSNNNDNNNNNSNSMMNNTMTSKMNNNGFSIDASADPLFKRYFLRKKLN